MYVNIHLNKTIEYATATVILKLEPLFASFLVFTMKSCRSVPLVPYLSMCNN